MTFDEIGFVSEETLNHTKTFKLKYKNWFELADKFNRTAQKQINMFHIPRTSNKQPIFKAMLFMRGLSSFQAALVLIERGLVHDARTLIRSCVETVFYLGAVCADPNFINEFQQEGKSRLKKVAEQAQKVVKAHNMDAQNPHLLELNAHVEALVNEPKSILSIEEVAKKAGLGFLYDSFYRGLSTDSAHPTTTALIRFIDIGTDGQIVGLKWEPNENEVENTLFHACVAASHLSNLVNDMVTDYNAISADQKECAKIYQQLTDKFEHNS